MNTQMAAFLAEDADFRADTMTARRELELARCVLAIENAVARAQMEAVPTALGIVAPSREYKGPSEDFMPFLPRTWEADLTLGERMARFVEMNGYRTDFRLLCSNDVTAAVDWDGGFRFYVGTQCVAGDEETQWGTMGDFGFNEFEDTKEFQRAIKPVMDNLTDVEDLAEFNVAEWEEVKAVLAAVEAEQAEFFRPLKEWFKNGRTIGEISSVTGWCRYGINCWLHEATKSQLALGQVGRRITWATIEWLMKRHPETEYRLRQIREALCD